MYFLQFSKNFQRVCVGGCVGGCVCLCVTSEKAATNTGQRGNRKQERERDRMGEREKESGLPTRVNIKLPKTICNFWKFCTVCCVWHREGTEGEGREAWQWRRLVLQAARIPLAQIPWLLTHTQPHTQAHTHKFITSGCGQKVCNILICVSAGAHLHVYGRQRGIGEVWADLPPLSMTLHIINLGTATFAESIFCGFCAQRQNLQCSYTMPGSQTHLPLSSTLSFSLCLSLYCFFCHFFNLRATL